jgi:hypothetical protein
METDEFFSVKAFDFMIGDQKVAINTAAKAVFDPSYGDGIYLPK